jgi:thiamine biosynthesis lipoprotein
MSPKPGQPISSILVGGLIVAIVIGGWMATSAQSSRVGPSASAPTTGELPPAPESVQVESRVMGTLVKITAYGSERADHEHVHGAIAAAVRELRRLDGAMSSWHADSDVSRVNASQGKPVEVGPDTFEVIQKGLWASRISSGAFDITFASMGKMWEFPGAGIVPSEIPSEEKVAQRRGLVDYRAVEVDAQTRTVRIPAGRKIGLGGIAKGYAVDRAAAVMRSRGLSSFLIQAGGDLYAAGEKPDGRGWTVALQDPRGPAGASFATIELRDCAMSTAGDYERYFIEEGRRFHHIIDPRTGYPATAARSVNLLAESAFVSDVVDDIVFILGPQEALPIVESIAGAGAIVVDADNRLWVSERLKGRVNFTRSPTP